jgi:hypothetical protein
LIKMCSFLFRLIRHLQRSISSGLMSWCEFHLAFKQFIYIDGKEKACDQAWFFSYACSAPRCGKTGKSVKAVHCWYLVFPELIELLKLAAVFWNLNLM